MRVFISVDIEGICCVVNGDSTGPQGKSYDQGRRQMTAEVNAAVEGALAAGATEVVVNDSHGGMNNIFPADIHPDAKVILGTPKPFMMMEGISAEFDAAMFIGYHSRMHSPGILSHTISGGTVSNVWINGVLCGETGINAGLAGHFGVPVVLVSGDDCLAREANELLGPVEAVVVKEAVTRYSARNLHPTRAVSLIRERVESVLKEAPKTSPLTFAAPVTMRLELLNAGQADAASFLPGSVRVDGRTMEFTGKDYITAFQGLRTMISLARP